MAPTVDDDSEDFGDCDVAEASPPAASTASKGGRGGKGAAATKAKVAAQVRDVLSLLKVSLCFVFFCVEVSGSFVSGPRSCIVEV